MVDFHSHTTASDGQYSPSALVKKMSELKISVLAVTDHDTVAGLKEAKKEAETNGIAFIPGIEITIENTGGEFHLLGLGLQNISQSMYKLIESIQDNRKARNKEIIRRMNAANIEISLEEIQNEFPQRTLGRPHFASWLEKKGIVKKRQDAFDKYLAKGRPWYIENKGAKLIEAVKAVNESGGVAVIAHPLSLYLSWKKLESFLEEIHQCGVMGLEAYHPCAKVCEGKRLENLAGKIGFFVTAGSDFHGELVRKDRIPGHACGGIEIEDRFWDEQLKPALEKCGWKF